MIGVVDFGLGEQVIVAALVEVTFEEAVGQPSSPVDGELIADVGVVGVDGYGDDEQAEEHADGAPEAWPVLSGQGGGEFAGLLIKENVELGAGDQE